MKYENLYDTKNVNDLDIENYLESNNIKFLSTTAKNNCDKFSTLDECKDTVISMKSNKAHGIDLLSVEFYQCFSDQLSSYFFIC